MFWSTCTFQFTFQLVDLKAELYRKQEQFKHDRLGQDAGAAQKSKTKIKVRHGQLMTDRCDHSIIMYTPVVIVIVCLCVHRSLISGVNKMKESMYERRGMSSKLLRKKTH